MSVIDGLERAEGFTEAERDLARFILAHADDATHMSIAQLAQAAFSSNATIVRLCRKAGTDGWRAFRVQLAADLEKRRVVRSNLDPSTPFEPGEGTAEVMSALAALHKDAVDDCYASVSPQDVNQVAHLLKKAHSVYVFASGDSRISAMAFANMAIKLGMRVVIADQYGDELATAYAMTPSDVALFVSYSGKIADNPEMHQIVRLLAERACPSIWISAADKPSALGLVLRLPSREDKVGKMATFYSQACVRYLLNCVYGAIWALDYEGNALRKLRFDQTEDALGHLSPIVG